jgi:DNA-binding NarL/FixJ family response regulator
VRGAIHSYIEASTPYRVCAEAGDGAAAIEKAREFGCDLVVLDLSMPGMNGVQAASVLRHMLPRPKIVGFTMFGEEFRKYMLAETGFDLVLAKHDGLEKLEKAITSLLAASDDD